MRVAVTGASGFIGRHATAHLMARGDTVVRIARPFVPAPLAAAFRQVDAVVHLAGVVAATTEAAYFEANVAATRVVAEAAREAGVRLVHVSSLAAAGPAPAAAPRSEDDPPAPMTAYGRSKLEGEATVSGAAGLHWTILRPGVVYGRGDRALVPLFRLARSGVLPLIGRSTAAYTFIHVADAVNAIAAAVDRAPVGRTIFVGHPRPVTARELIEGVRARAGGGAAIVRVPQPILRAAATVGDAIGWMRGRPFAINSRRYDELAAPGFVCRVDRLREELGVEPRIGLDEGLRDAAPWYLSQI